MNITIIKESTHSWISKMAPHTWILKLKWIVKKIEMSAIIHNNSTKNTSGHNDNWWHKKIKQNQVIALYKLKKYSSRESQLYYYTI